VISAAFGGNTARKLDIEPSVTEITAFRRDYEERQAEIAEELEYEDLHEEPSTDTGLFTDKAAADAASAKADAKTLAADRRAQALAQGYTGNMCGECQNFTMVRNGTCEKCNTCGATSGCS
jgi:ribonucleoside-diphosphate reductase alpha chain